MQLSFSAAELSQIVQPREIRGSTGASITRISSLENSAPGDLSFLGNPKYRAQVPACLASIVLLPPDYQGEPAPDQAHFIVENPSVALALICSRIEQSLWPKPEPGIHPSACVSPEAHVAPTATVGPLCVVEAGARLGERVHLQAQVFIGRDAIVGDDSWLMPGVIVATQCQVGRRVRLQPGVVVGSDGFGYEFVAGRHQKLPQVGSIIICDDVEIGANTTLDRARFSNTIIGEGTKIDNLVQVGHNVSIGKHCILCSQVGISGSVTIEDYVVLAGQAGVAGHLTIGKAAKVGGQAAVLSSIEPGSYIIGNPPLPFMLDRRINVLRKRLPDLFKRVDRIEEHLKLQQGEEMRD